MGDTNENKEQTSEIGLNPDNSKAVVGTTVRTLGNGKRIIGVFLCVTSVVLAIICICLLNSRKYAFYKEHYKESLDGYNENIDYAYSLGTQFRSNFLEIAHTYKDLMDKDMAKINAYQTGATVLGIFSGITIVTGMVLLINSASKGKM